MTQGMLVLIEFPPTGSVGAAASYGSIEDHLLRTFGARYRIETAPLNTPVRDGDETTMDAIRRDAFHRLANDLTARRLARDVARLREARENGEEPYPRRPVKEPEAEPEPAAAVHQREARKTSGTIDGVEFPGAEHAVLVALRNLTRTTDRQVTSLRIYDEAIGASSASEHTRRGYVGALLKSAQARTKTPLFTIKRGATGGYRWVGPEE